MVLAVALSTSKEKLRAPYGHILWSHHCEAFVGLQNGSYTFVIDSKIVMPPRGAYHMIVNEWEWRSGVGQMLRQGQKKVRILQDRPIKIHSMKHGSSCLALNLRNLLCAGYLCTPRKERLRG